MERQAGLRSPVICYSGSLVLNVKRTTLRDAGIRLEMAVSFKRFVLERFSGIVVSEYIFDVWLVDDASHPAA